LSRRLLSTVSRWSSLDTLSQWLIDVGGDDPGTFQGLELGGVHFQVVGHALVDQVGLWPGHAKDSVTAGDLTGRSHLRVASDTNPEHGQWVESFLPLPLGYRAAEEDLIQDDVRSGLGHGGDAGHPGGLQGTEVRPDDDLAGGAELNPKCRHRWRRGRRLHQSVRTESQPWIREDRLQAPGDPGFPWAGPAVQDDHLNAHYATVQITPPAR
jgi:hypothetical protein